MTGSLAILGAGGHGRVIADAALQQGWKAITFFDDMWPTLRSNRDWPVNGDSQALASCTSDFDGVIVAIGDNQVRVRKARYLSGQGAVLVSIVHPGSIVSEDSVVGGGTVICAGAIVNIGTRIGLACIVNSNATVEHDCTLADGVHISPGANIGGNVKVGRYSWIGIGATVRHGTRIGRQVIVGGGAMVISDVDDRLTVVGVPARPKE